MVDLSLWRIKANPFVPPDVIVYPRWISICGFLTCSAVFALELIRLASR